MVGFEECLLGIFVEKRRHMRDHQIKVFCLSKCCGHGYNRRNSNCQCNGQQFFMIFLISATCEAAPVCKYKCKSSSFLLKACAQNGAPAKKSSPDLRWNDHVKFVYPKQACGGHKCKMKHFHIDSLHVQFIQNKIKNFALGFPNGEHQCNRYPSRGLQRQKNCHQT